MKTIYKCERCGLEFSDQLKCLDHELEDHIEPCGVTVKPLRYLPHGCETNNPDEAQYPVDISVAMTDGSLIEYTFRRIITPAPTEGGETE